MLGYVTEVWPGNTGGWLQQEGNFPLTNDLRGPSTGAYEFNGSGFTVGQRVVFTPPSDGSNFATGVQPA